jgi:integrase
MDEDQGKFERTSSASASSRRKEEIMQRTRIQRGGVNLDVSSSGKKIWVFRWRETKLDGRRAPRKRVIGTLEEYPTKEAAEKAARNFRLDLVDRGSAAFARITMKELVNHFTEHEQVDKGEEGRAYSTRDRCESVLNCWIIPRWGKAAIDQIRTVAVEDWLRSIPRARGTRSKMRNTMSALYNHAIRWEFIDRNPITGPVRGSGVRQSAKRERIPDILEVEEFQHLQAELRLRERILVWLDMTLGLRRGELAGLRWEDVRFEELTVMARRSIVDQVVGNVKTEASKRPIPIDAFVAEDLLAWYRITKYSRPADYVFATDAPRAGKKRGKQPVWLSKLMTYHIQPAAKRVGITKHIGWHTFRHTYTTLLHANGEDVKVVQELLRHGSAKITMDVYAQAVTPAKRMAQGKIVAMLRRGDERAV